MNSEERAQIERELRENGFMVVDDIPYSQKQIALLTWHKLDELSRAVAALEEDRIGREEVESMFDKQRGHLFKVTAMLLTIVTVTITIALGLTH